MAEKFLSEELDFTIVDNIIIGSNLHWKETRNVAQIMIDSLTRHPDFIAQIDAATGETTSFREIKDRSTRCALWLRKHGICENDVIGIMTHNQQDDFIPFLSTLFVNAICSPWSHETTEMTAHSYFQTCRPKVMFASERTIDMLSKAASKARVDCKFVVYGEHSTFPSLKSFMAQQTAEEVSNFKYAVPKESGRKVGMIFFSSGTTGNPKATMLPYDCLIERVPAHNVKNNHVDYCLWYSSLAWITGMIWVASMIQWRFTRILHAEFEPTETSRIIEKYKINVMAETPTMLTQSFKAGVFTKCDHASLKLIIISGSSISTTVLQACRKHLPRTLVSNGYGMTEAGRYVTRQTKQCQKVDSIGFVFGDVSLKVVDGNTGQALGPNQQGEICFKTAGGMLGYMNDEEATKKVIDKDGWIHSGDLGYYDANGEITLVDRMKNIINVHSSKVSPAAIENILLKHPAVAKCAVVGVPHDVDVERPFAFVVKVPGVQVTAEELIKLPAVHKASYKLSGGLVFVDDLAYTVSGKINLRQMKEKAKTYECS